MQVLTIESPARRLALAIFAIGLAAIVGLLSLGRAVPAHANVLAVSGGGLSYSLAEGDASTVTVAQFTADETGAPGNFTVSINWGDGSAATGGTVQETSTPGTYNVLASHPYADEGTYTIVSTVTDTVQTSSADDSGTAPEATITEGDSPTLSAQNVNVDEGQAFSGSTLNFTQSFDNSASDFSAIIDWGDGTTPTAGTVVRNSAGSYSVNGTHTYTEEGSFPISTTVNDDSPSSLAATGVSAATVADAPLTATAVTLNPQEGVPSSNVIVATFTDPDPTDGEHMADYSATISWGDGATSAGVIGKCNATCVGGVAAFKVRGSHTYTEGCTCAVVVNISDEGGATAVANSTANVADSVINGVAQSLSAVEGQAFSGQIATFTDTDPTVQSASNYTVTADWGDGTLAGTNTGTNPTLTITGSGPSFAINGSHTWAEEATSLPVTITITDTGGALQSPSPLVSHVQVSDANLAGTAVNISPIEGEAFDGMVATFSDADPLGAPTDYTATISWGDGASSSGTIQQCVVADACPDGITDFKVVGTHTYAEEGTPSGGSGNLSVHIADAGASADTTSAPTVADAPIAVTGAGTIQALAGQALTNQLVATFLDGDSGNGENGADYTASIDWGDSTVNAGTVSPAGGGGFQVTGTHTYTTNGIYTATITVTDDGGSHNSATTTFDIGSLLHTLSTLQYTLSSSDGVTWAPIDPTRLSLTVSPAADESVLLGGNADLWTANPGVNQDLGIFMTDNGGDPQLLGWKESGGFAGTFSPNAAYVQWLQPLSAGHTYVFSLDWKANKPSSGTTIYAGAGPIGSAFSPTSLTAKIFSTAPSWNVITTQPTLSNSDGATWQPLGVSTTLNPTADSTALLGANADLWTANAGYNQDLGIFVSDNGGADQLVGWKESGGFAGTFSPNAAFAQATWPMSADHSYVFKLKWKTNRSAPGSTIYAGAGPIGTAFSPTDLVAETFPAGSNPATMVSTSQYHLSNSDGATWQLLDPALNVSLSPTNDTDSLLGANADLWTANAGYNQDLGIFVSDNGGADQLLAWKESGGFAGTFSPNAAFAQGTFHMTAGHTYVFKLKWKTNKPASGTTIYAGASPSAPFSPTRLTVDTTG
jgi:hypothetical protein